MWQDAEIRSRLLQPQPGVLPMSYSHSKFYCSNNYRQLKRIYCRKLVFKYNSSFQGHFDSSLERLVTPQQDYTKGFLRYDAIFNWKKSAVASVAEPEHIRRSRFEGPAPPYVYEKERFLNDIFLVCSNID